MSVQPKPRLAKARSTVRPATTRIARLVFRPANSRSGPLLATGVMVLSSYSSKYGASSAESS